MKPIILGVAGGSGSGKTTVALRLAESLSGRRVVIVHHDSYYRDRADLSPAERERLNFDHPDAFENELLLRHLVELGEGGAIEQPIYSYERHAREPRTLTVGPAHVVIVEGIQVLAVPELRERFDIKLYVDCDADERLARRLLRDLHERGRSVHSVLDQYRSTVRPMHLQFVEPSKRWADVVIPRGGHNQVAIDLIASKLREVLCELEREVETA
ncbi:MAG: uridine kinase [bacterium]